MKEKYLIVKCEPLNDQWECDADREPIAMTEDWEKWYKENLPRYDFEVYELQKDASFKKIANETYYGNY